MSRTSTEQVHITDHAALVMLHDSQFVPENIRSEYCISLEQLFRYANNLVYPSKLGVFAYYVEEERVKRLVEIVSISVNGLYAIHK